MLPLGKHFAVFPAQAKLDVGSSEIQPDEEAFLLLPWLPTIHACSPYFHGCIPTTKVIRTQNRGGFPIEPLLLLALLVACLIFSHISWGPGTHIFFGTQILDQMESRLKKEQQQLLEEHRDAFLYGGIAADIINFKKYGGIKNHCHNWNMKERFEALIQHEHEYAFLYGYLCHLAADVVAHNHFVPFQLLHNLPPVLLGHTYWEARADVWVPEKYWDLIDGFRSQTELHENDEIINRAVRKKALSLSSNKWIFNNVLLARSKKSWRDLMDQMLSRKPRGEIQQEFMDDCHRLCLENMWRVFDDLELTQLREQDPNGHECLKQSRIMRRNLVQKHGSRSAGAEEAKSIAYELYGIQNRP